MSHESTVFAQLMAHASCFMRILDDADHSFRLKLTTRFGLI